MRFRPLCLCVSVVNLHFVHPFMRQDDSRAAEFPWECPLCVERRLSKRIFFWRAKLAEPSCLLEVEARVVSYQSVYNSPPASLEARRHRGINAPLSPVLLEPDVARIFNRAFPLDTSLAD